MRLPRRQSVRTEPQLSSSASFTPCEVSDVGKRLPGAATANRRDRTWLVHTASLSFGLTLD